MTWKPPGVVQAPVASGMARVERALNAIAKAAWYLALIVAGMRFLDDMLSGIYVGRRPGATGGQVTSFLLGIAARSVLKNAAPAWITFALIWFFAAWAAKVAEKRARAERLQEGQ